MLLIDGVKYAEWMDLKEIEDLEPMVVEHAKDIFGESALYIDRKQKLKSLAGIGSIPDAYVISLDGNSPHWHIVEIELSYKDPGRHLVTQLNDFINGMKNSRNEIVSAINQWIKNDDIRALEFKRRNTCEDIHEFLSDLIKNDPILTIVIEKNTTKLKEAIKIFEEKYKTEIVEFKTFRREGAETVHAHLFEPLYVSTILKTPKPEAQNAAISVNDIFLDIKPFNLNYKRLRINKKYLNTLSLTHDLNFQLETEDGDIINTKIDRYNEICTGMGDWYKKHPELQIGDTLLFKVIVPGKKYRLEIVKK